MSDSKVVLVNRALIHKLLEQRPTLHSPSLEAILSSGIRRLQDISKLPGCKCKRGPKKSKVYDDILTQLRQLPLEDIEPLKAHFNATTLNLGKGHQI